MKTGLLQIGSFGLYIVHGAFEAGVAASRWNIDEFMKSLYWLFKDTPAKCEHFCPAVNNEKKPLFPMEVCPTSWVENVPVTERAMTVIPQV